MKNVSFVKSADGVTNSTVAAVLDQQTIARIGIVHGEHKRAQWNVSVRLYYIVELLEYCSSNQIHGTELTVVLYFV